MVFIVLAGALISASKSPVPAEMPGDAVSSIGTVQVSNRLAGKLFVRDKRSPHEQRGAEKEERNSQERPGVG